jgi:hypothetical protein
VASSAATGKSDRVLSAYQEICLIPGTSKTGKSLFIPILRSTLRYEPVSLSEDCLQDLWPFRVVLQASAKFVNRRVNPMPRIHKYAIAPQPLNNFSPRDQPSLILSEKNQEFRGIFLQLNHTIPASQLTASQVQMEFIELDDLGRHSGPLPQV